MKRLKSTPLSWLVANTLAFTGLLMSGPLDNQFSVADVIQPAPRVVQTAVAELIPARPEPTQLKVINYFPAQAGWSRMWSDYSHDRTNADFAAISSLGANTVRVIVSPYALGWPSVSPTGASVFRDLMDTAFANQLFVQLTLFDEWGQYDRVADSKTWVSSLLSAYAGEPRLVLIELQNEINPGNQLAIGWARRMLAHIRSVLPGVPRTLTVRGLDDPTNLDRLLRAIPSSLIDVIDLHLYSSIGGNTQILSAARKLAGTRPVIIGETGTPTSSNGDTTTDQSQAKYFTVMRRLCQQFGIPFFSPWTLNDFTSEGLLDGLPVREKYFGIRRIDGSWKPTAAVVRAMYATEEPHVPSTTGTSDSLATTLNALMSDQNEYSGSFEHELSSPSSTGSLGYWSVTPAHASLVGTMEGVGPDGSRGAYLSGTGGTESAVPALFQDFGTGFAKQISVAVNTRLVGATGSTRVSIAWFRGDQYVGQVESSTGANSSATWQRLTTSGTVPMGATSFQVHLKSESNAGYAYFDDVFVVYS